MTNRDHSPSIAKNDGGDAKSQLKPGRHVPGPWRVDPHSRARIEAPNAPKGSMFIAEARGWGHLTGRGHGALALEDEVACGIQDANARLIAAAPDLYYALKTCIQRIERPELSPGADVVLEKARAALVKASPPPSARPGEGGSGQTREAGKSLPEGDA